MWCSAFPCCSDLSPHNNTQGLGFSQKLSFVATCHFFTFSHPSKYYTTVHSVPSMNVIEGDLKYRFVEVFLRYFCFCSSISKHLKNLPRKQNLKTSKAKKAVHETAWWKAISPEIWDHYSTSTRQNFVAVLNTASLHFASVNITAGPRTRLLICQDSSEVLYLSLGQRWLIIKYAAPIRRSFTPFTQSTELYDRSRKISFIKSFQIFVLHLRLVDHLRKNSSNSNKREN